MNILATYLYVVFVLNIMELFLSIDTNYHIDI